MAPSNNVNMASAFTMNALTVRALAYKWIRIVFRCWKTNTPYNESVYLKALKRRGSPLMNQVADAIIT